jgi:transcriptional regulator with XRE-family HTH domain
LTITLKSIWEVQHEFADRFKARRLALNFTQEELAARSGVSWSSLKRFEREGLIALDSLLKIALVLSCLNDFEKVADNQQVFVGQSLDKILATPPPRRRATSKKSKTK